MGCSSSPWVAWWRLDTNEFYPLSRDQVAESWMKMLDKSRELLGGAMVSGSNDYVIGRTDRIYDAPVDSIDAFGDLAVLRLPHRLPGPGPPHHLRRQSAQRPQDGDPAPDRVGHAAGLPADQPGHGRPDPDRLPAPLQRTGLPLDRPRLDEYKKMRDEFGYLNGKFITNHEILANRVNRVTYEDGSQILVNYNPEPYSGPGGTSPPTATSCASHSRAGNARKRRGSNPPARGRTRD